MMMDAMMANSDIGNLYMDGQLILDTVASTASIIFILGIAVIAVLIIRFFRNRKK